MRRFIDCVRAIGAIAFCAPVAAQTIADYSRAQRAVIEASIARQAPVASPLPSLMPANSIAPAIATGRVAPSLPLPSGPVQEVLAPRLDVTGVVMLADRRFAEVAVDGAHYVLSAGESVPGTPWTIKTISAVDVVLSSSGRRSSTRTFRVGGAGH